MLLGIITDGTINDYTVSGATTTYYITDLMDGCEYNNIFHYPFITNSNDISFGGEPQVKLELGSLTFNMQDMPEIQTKREWNIKLIFTTDINFSLVIPFEPCKAIVRDKTKDEITVKLKNSELLYDLLTPAPNTKIGDGRFAGTYTNDWKKYHTELVYPNYGTDPLSFIDYTRILFFRPIVNNGTVVVQNQAGTVTYTLGTDYTLDFTGGTITVLHTGNIPNLSTIRVFYYYSIYNDQDVVFYVDKYYKNNVAGGATVTSPPNAPWTEIAEEDVFNEGRTYPMMFGRAGSVDGINVGGDGLYIQPLQLNDYQLTYFNSYGEILGVFDKGIPVEYSTFADGRFQLVRNPVDQITIMVDGDDYNFNDAYTVQTVTSDMQVPYPNTTYTQANAPDPTLVFLKEGDSWINTSAGNAVFAWDGSNWQPVSNIAVDQTTGAIVTVSEDFYSYSFKTSAPAIADQTGNPPCLKPTGHGSVSFGIGTEVQGVNSFGAGYFAKANGSLSCVAIGHQVEVQGNYSVAMGIDNLVIGDASLAVGKNNYISGLFGFATGEDNEVKASWGFASGFGNTLEVGGSYGGAFGYQNTLSGSYGFVAGRLNIVSGARSLSTGYSNNVSGSNSGAFGYENMVSSNTSFAFGRDNEVSSVSSMALGDYLFTSGFSTLHCGYRGTVKKEGTLFCVSGGQYPFPPDLTDGINDARLFSVHKTGGFNNSKGRGFIQVPYNDADPAEADNGALYYHLTTHKLRLKANGSWVNLN